MKNRLLLALLLVGLAGGGLAQQIGDPARGRQVFNKCIACHKVGPDARIGIGPPLNGIVGRPAGTYRGYTYSNANANSGVTWDVETLTAYLPAPSQFLPGTKMIFPGLSEGAGRC